MVQHRGVMKIVIPLGIIMRFQKVRKKMFNLLKVILAMMHVVAFAATLVSLTNKDNTYDITMSYIGTLLWIFSSFFYFMLYIRKEHK